MSNPATAAAAAATSAAAAQSAAANAAIPSVRSAAPPGTVVPTTRTAATLGPSPSPGPDIAGRGGRTGQPLPLRDAESLRQAYGNARAPYPEVAQWAGPAHGRAGTVVGTPILTRPGMDAVAEFLADNPRCQASEAEVRRFLNIVRQADLNGTDVIAVARTLFVSGIAHERVYAGLGRAAGMAFTPHTTGVRGVRGAEDLPSLLWEIATRFCNDLPAVNQALEDLFLGQFGFEVPALPPTKVQPPLGTPPEQAAQNDALALFLASHPACRPDEQALREILNLLDSSHLSGTDFESIIRALAIEGWVVPLPSTYRSGRAASGGGTLPLAPATLGLRGKQANVVKKSLLWAILEQYCLQAPQIARFLNNVVSGAAMRQVQGEVGTRRRPSAGARAAQATAMATEQ